MLYFTFGIFLILAPLSFAETCFCQDSKACDSKLCPAGCMFSIQEGRCLESPPGQYITLCCGSNDQVYKIPYASSLCSACNNTVSPCKPGTYTPASGKSSQAMCSACPQGHFCPEGSATPNPCPVGYYSSTIGISAISQCEPCPMGTFCPTAGTSSPTVCNAGFFNDKIASNQSSHCIICPKGFFCGPGTSTPTPCIPGTWSNLLGAKTCSLCPKGFFCPSSSMITATPCPPGTFSATTGAASIAFCSSCPPGHYCGSKFTAPVPCERGYFSISSSS